ncbi:MAG: hypothetical protein ACLUDH_13430 [Faecalispora sporosphaeroides]|uniref:hypothetical protein n=1 Tax=Faecalispora sporosphaeroides TaxID=1549 RepID=UPI003996152D
MEIAEQLIAKSMEMPGAYISREMFLRKALGKYCDEEVLEKAIQTTPALAGISSKIITQIANSEIDKQCKLVTGLSFLAGLPSNPLTMPATIAADTTQFHFQTIQIIQKLMYLYGWGDSQKHDKIDDELYAQIIVLLGVAYGVANAQKFASKIASRISLQIAQKLPQKALSKNIIFTITKKVLKWVGVKITKDTFAKGISKAVPVVSGIVSGGISLVMMKKLTNQLKVYLESTPLANPDMVVDCDNYSEIDDERVLDEMIAE